MDPVVRFGIGGLAMAVAAVVAGMVWVADRRRFPAVLGAIIAIMAIQFAAAASGLLRPWDRTPPLIAPLIAIALVLTVLLAFSRTGMPLSGNSPFPRSLLFRFFVCRWNS
jgi:ribose/xylose/arabinose/galactoside ABC-type transport system permease subunit